MDPLFLTDVEEHPKPSPYRDLIAQMRRSGAEYPQIWHLFAYLPSATTHLARFTQEVLREPAPLSAGLRELIAEPLESGWVNYFPPYEAVHRENLETVLAR